MKKGLKVIWVVIFLLAVFATSTGDVTPAKALAIPQIVSVDPQSPQPVGTCIKVTVKIDGSSDYGSMHVRFANEGWQESSELQFSRTFCTNNYDPGTYRIQVEARSNTDNSWSNPTSNYVPYQLTAPAGPPKGPNVNFSFNPPNDQTVGNSVNIHVTVNSNNPGATKINVSCGGVSKIETSEVQFDSTWNTNGCDSGAQQITVCSRDVNDPNWANPTCSTQTYNLSPAPVNVPVPSAKFTVDSNQIQNGQCTYLRWQTSGTDSVNIDGNTVNDNGSEQVCPTVTEKYTLTATNQSGSANRNITIVVSNQPPSSDVASHFQTGDVIQIGPNIYVIVSGERDLVPNPDTLDALGISRSWVNNKRFSDADLSTIPQGSDVPDVDRDPSGFAAFKAQYFPNTNPINPGPIATAPPVSQPQNPPQQGGTSGNNSCSWYVGARVGLKAGSMIRVGSGMSYKVEAQVPSDNWQVDIIDGPRSADGVTWWDISRKNLDGGGTGWVYFEQAGMHSCNSSSSINQGNQGNQGNQEPVNLALDSPFNPEGGQEQKSFWDWIMPGFTVSADERLWCTDYVYSKRSDLAEWLANYPDANLWDNRARKAGYYGITVNPADPNQPPNFSDIRKGDIVVWNEYCGNGVGSRGHVGLVLENVKNGDRRVLVTDANHFVSATSVSQLPLDLQNNWLKNPWVVKDDNNNILGYDNGKVYSSESYPILDCMAFIHEPPPPPYDLMQSKPGESSGQPTGNCLLKNIPMLNLLCGAGK
jgi:hypothetical protein